MATFKTRARAVDMLGRQQIAGIPTAISELFKNAHDAYADNVEVDYFQKEKIFLLRDDGRGMSKDDFLNRWLVIGTESKIEDKRNKPLDVPEGKTKRPILGEKGIGRLSIASIGRQLIVLSRGKSNNNLSKIIVAIINWGLFEIPGLDLDQIVIPVEEFESIPSFDNVINMIEQAKYDIEKLYAENKINSDECTILLNDLALCPKDFKKYYDRCPTERFLEEQTGTHFFISSLNSSLDDCLTKTEDSASKLEKFLIGFANTMTPNHQPPLIDTAFRAHYTDDNYQELIDTESFFSTEDFKNADHHFTGQFDENGQFNGKINIYNKHTIEHTIPWNGNSFKKTLCGPFSIDCAYLQGALRQSSLDPIKHAALRLKSDRFGGLYIYRDGVRILPYGDNDYDFLDIEKNRTKSASYYFFSYRRMFGVINISKAFNSKLFEKAGREGFVENQAYKQMRDILMNFFTQLAADFFRESDKGGNGTLTEYWETIRKEQEAIHRAREKREKLVKTKKENLSNSLNLFFQNFQNKVWQRKSDEVLKKLNLSLKSIESIDDPDIAVQKLVETENVSRNELKTIRSETDIKNVRGVPLSREQRENWEIYIEQRMALERDVFQGTEHQITSTVSDFRTKFNINVTNKRRIQEAVVTLSDSIKSEAKEKRQAARNVASDMAKKVRQLTQELMERIEQSIRKAQTEFTELNTIDLPDESIQDTINKIEEPLLKEKDNATQLLESVISQIEGIYWERDNDGKIITNKQISDSIEEEIDELKNRNIEDSELIQLGLAVNIIHHEFASVVKAFRADLRLLKQKSATDIKLKNPIKNLNANFVHLDQYLSLLTPFNRRLYKEKELIKSLDLFFFLMDVFRGKLTRHGIQLKCTQGFENTTFSGYKSVFYPVFTNLVDNAIYWLKQKQTDADKIIRLHAEGDNFYISNNGIEIPIQDKDRIFEFGYSRKPHGRGMGLAISRDVLAGVGYELKLTEPRQNMTVTFIITPTKKIEEQKNE